METGKQKLFVAVAAVLILVSASVATTFFIKTGRLGGAGDDGGYKNVTFTDAVMTCKKNMESRFKKRLRTYAVDNHSSRFEDKLFMYKIFIKADMTSEEDGKVNLHYVNCFVRASSGRINKFEVFEDREEETSPVTEKETNAFGWPK